MKKNLKIGITGGIGSGKSLVTGFIEKMGYPVIKSDDVAKDLMQNDEQVKRRIIKEFGASVYKNGILDTKFLAGNVFSSPEKVLAINSIVHPATTQKVDQLAGQLFAQHRLVFVESALIFEAEIEDQFDYVVLIYSDEKTRIERVMKRQKISLSEIEKRISFQMPEDQKKELADFVIDNSSTIAELESRTGFIVTLFKSLLPQ